jgi:hypothetical protein
MGVRVQLELIAAAVAAAEANLIYPPAGYKDPNPCLLLRIPHAIDLHALTPCK